MARAKESRRTATQFRRNYFVASMVPLVVFFLVVLAGAVAARYQLAALIAESTYELNADAERNLEKLGERIVANKASDVARQLSIYVRTHPDATIEELRDDPAFRVLAIQPVGESGYTSLTDSGRYLIRMHPNRALEDRDMRELREDRPDWWRIVEASVARTSAGERTGAVSSGYYDWIEPDGSIRRKYLFSVPMDAAIGGAVHNVSATTYIDEFSAPVVSMRSHAAEIVDRYRTYVDGQWLLFSAMFAAVVLLALMVTYRLGTRAARRFIDPIDRLAEAASNFGSGGEGMTGVEDVARRDDEIGTLARVLERMSSRIRDLLGRLETQVEELHRAQTALQASEEHYRQLYQESKRAEELYGSVLRSSVDAIVTLDTDLRATYMSPAFTRLFGWTEDDLVDGRMPYIPPTHLDATLERLERVLADGVPIEGYETQRLTRDGRFLDVSVSASRFYDHEGNPAGVLSILRDISEKKRVEREMQRVDRLKSLGTLAGGIAHDFNNLLMVIQGNVSMLLTGAHSSEEQARLASIEEQIQSGANLTRQLLGYARKGRYEVSVADLNDAVRRTAETFRMTRKDIVVAYDLDPGLAPIEADFYQIEQVLMNLYVNAADAMPDGGDLRIRTRNVTIPPGAEAGERPGVELVVEDTGLGMSEATMKQIFDPFFTTKDMGRGTGLGLASVYGIVDAHGGSIDVASTEGQGTTFTVTLPASARQPPALAPETRPIATGEGTILLVDDEPRVLEVGAQMLKRLGYHVISAGSGAEALKLYAARGDDVDLVMLDMVMPGMSGSQVFDGLKALNPDVDVLLSTGYSLDERNAEGLTEGCRGYVLKPYSLSELSVKIREILGAGKDRGAVRP